MAHFPEKGPLGQNTEARKKSCIRAFKNARVQIRRTWETLWPAEARRVPAGSFAPRWGHSHFRPKMVHGAQATRTVVFSLEEGSSRYY